MSEANAQTVEVNPPGYVDFVIHGGRGAVIWATLKTSAGVGIDLSDAQFKLQARVDAEDADAAIEPVVAPDADQEANAGLFYITLTADDVSTGVDAGILLFDCWVLFSGQTIPNKALSGRFIFERSITDVSTFGA